QFPRRLAADEQLVAALLRAMHDGQLLGVRVQTAERTAQRNVRRANATDPPASRAPCGTRRRAARKPRRTRLSQMINPQMTSVAVICKTWRAPRPKASSPRRSDGQCRRVTATALLAPAATRGDANFQPEASEIPVRRAARRPCGPSAETRVAARDAA